MMDCLFCKIIAGEIPSNKVYEDDLVYAFRDIAPQAPTHILVIPKEHLFGVSDITPENSALVAHIFEVIPAIAKAEGLTEEEILERDRLRREYVAAFRENLVAELENTYIVDAKGNKHKLKSKAEKQADKILKYPN